jgi:hypothetical protein
MVAPRWFSVVKQGEGESIATLEVRGPLRVQGWAQFLTSKQEMLDAYDRTRTQAKSHEVETYHGEVAEEYFRGWLGTFLPKKYAVTAGHVVSQGNREETKLPHFDVIIYDLLESPVLWVEKSGPKGETKAQAIPAEYVRAVLEVKAAYTSVTAAKAVEHLQDLEPLCPLDVPQERYKKYLPPSFFCGCVFFEQRKKDGQALTALNKLTEGIRLRGYMGGLILRGEGAPPNVAGRIGLVASQDPISASGGEDIRSFCLSDSVPTDDGRHVAALVMWSASAYANFAFDLVALLNGTYRPGYLSSFHGMGGTLRRCGNRERAV